MAEAQRKGHAINFDVLYYAKENDRDAIIEEIGMKEGEYIRKYFPVLNTQIPKEDDWRKFDTKQLDARKILKDLL